MLWLYLNYEEVKKTLLYFLPNINLHFTTLLFYTFIVFLLLFILFLIYIRVKYGFWVSQPVFHIYDFSYYWFPPGIIRYDLPGKNKYTNFKDTQTVITAELTEPQKSKFISFVQQHYLKNGDNIFQPELSNVVPYYDTAFKYPSFFTFYWEKNLLSDLKKGTIAEDNKMIGSIAGRPIHIRIHKAKDPTAHFYAYYVDFLCVDRGYRKKGIAPQLIQTHEYQQRHLNPEIYVSLFKREDQLTGIIPLCVYRTYGFPVTTWTKPLPLNSGNKTIVIEITKQNIQLLRDFLKENESQFDIVISTDIPNLMKCIETKNIHVWALLEEDQLLAAYFFRKTCVQVEKDMEVLCCFTSIKGVECSTEDFTQGFKIAFWTIAEKHHFGFCAVENIAHNHWIIENLVKKTRPTIKSPTAYFFYNFAYPTFQAEKTLCIV